ncbi:LacI family DNA-binding transcriptional regulator [Embleya scabrispora]|uniref:LacI family DNA-binding transcriptional regulator n=1 Tax=Embleya scabrispora TaxID=159449 RepID=UPI00039E3165|nr:substrate-binding domain-containing protein [Embleya scabrispora]MYS82072.1 substrate-binding domain-containing protein [Streptomyces sp. SID5474]
MTQRAWRRPSGSPTLTQIARAEGVPVPVVSKVLNGRSDVSPAVRRSVAARLREAGYTLSAPAGASAPDGLVDLVVSGVEGTWANAMLSGIERVLSRTGHDVVVVVARETEPDTRDWVQRLVDRGSRGAVIALVTPTSAQLRRLAAAGVRMVALDPHRPLSAGIPTVGATNWTGGRQAAEHLITLGHTRIAAIGGVSHHHYSQARLDGFRSALVAHGLDKSAAELVRHGNWSRRGAAEVARELLELPNAPTAVFACSDRMALGVFDVAAERGLRAPRDISVVGFDDLPEACWLSPALTTVRQPVQEMAGLAADTLLRLMAGESVRAPRIELETRLIERGSTSPPR